MLEGRSASKACTQLKHLKAAPRLIPLLATPQRATPRLMPLLATPQGHSSPHTITRSADTAASKGFRAAGAPNFRLATHAPVCPPRGASSRNAATPVTCSPQSSVHSRPAHRSE
eukprot:350794-Chlamydomonas_euryale.AAC.6